MTKYFDKIIKIFNDYFFFFYFFCIEHSLYSLHDYYSDFDLFNDSMIFNKIRL